MTKPQQPKPKPQPTPKLKDRTALAVVFFAGKQLFAGDTTKAAQFLDVARRLN